MTDDPNMLTVEEWQRQSLEFHAAMRAPANDAPAASSQREILAATSGLGRAERIAVALERIARALDRIAEQTTQRHALEVAALTGLVRARRHGQCRLCCRNSRGSLAARSESF